MGFAFITGTYLYADAAKICHDFTTVFGVGVFVLGGTNALRGWKSLGSLQPATKLVGRGIDWAAFVTVSNNLCQRLQTFKLRVCFVSKQAKCCDFL
jgi:hypothetical protein